MRRRLGLLLALSAGCAGQQQHAPLASAAEAPAPPTQVVIAEPATACSARLTVQPIGADRSTCVIDERVSSNVGELRCDGESAEVDFGTARFTGRFARGELDVSLRTEFDFQDGCTWASEQRIRGHLDGVLAYAYSEAPLPGQGGCADACSASAAVALGGDPARDVLLVVNERHQITRGEALSEMRRRGLPNASSEARAEGALLLADYYLLADAAAGRQLARPARGDEAAIRATEEALIAALGIAAREVVVISHAWIKEPAGRAARKALSADLERFHARAKSGAAFTDIFAELGLPGAQWHVADREEYEAAAFPDLPKTLAAGQTAPIFPSHEGFNIVRLIERTSGDVTPALYEALRAEGRVEWTTPP